MKVDQKPRTSRGANRLEQPLAFAQSWRFYMVLVFLVTCMMALVWRVIDLHIVNHEFLRSQGDMRTIRVEPIVASRGKIVDRHGEPLAVSAPVVTLWSNPQQVELDDPNWKMLAKLVDIKAKNLNKRLVSNSEREFIYIKRQISPELANEAMALKLAGLYSQRDFKRYYPEGEVTSHVVGFTDIDENGQEGIELVFDDWLKGIAGSKKVLKDRRGSIVKDLSLLEDAQRGKDVQLSIDLRLQYLAYRELKAAVAAHGAKSGSLVMLDVKTGEILAMVNQPAFNPNNRSSLRADWLRNRAITDVFEPGSTVKPFSIAAALNSGKFSTRSMVNTSPGFIRLNGRTIRDVKDYGKLDLPTVVSKSSNVGTSRVALKTGGEAIWDVFFQAGFGQATGVEFPGESIGTLPNYSKWRPISLATLSYGYGLSVTSLQLTQAFMAIADKGQRKPISLIKGGQTNMPIVQVMPEKIASQITGMLEKVVLKGGTGTRAQVMEYRVAGKTGTVHLIGANGYEEDEYISVFSGFAPVESPRVAMSVVVNQPQGSEYYGGEVAAPVFSRVMAGSLRLLNVAPDRTPGMANLAKDKGGQG